jgi:hypothetical protein
MPEKYIQANMRQLLRFPYSKKLRNSKEDSIRTIKTPNPLSNISTSESSKTNSESLSLPKLKKENTYITRIKTSVQVAK